MPTDCVMSVDPGIGTEKEREIVDGDMSGNGPLNESEPPEKSHDGKESARNPRRDSALKDDGRDLKGDIVDVPDDGVFQR
jgi:hypothetical protein